LQGDFSHDRRSEPARLRDWLRRGGVYYDYGHQSW
jgi:hypothetical protein